VANAVVDFSKDRVEEGIPYI